MRRQSGFTLIEVLVASFILFIAIGAFTLILRGALLSGSQAAEAVSRSAVLLVVTEDIAARLKEQHKASQASGRGLVEGVSYQWQARVVKTGKPPKRYFGSELIQQNHKIKQWQVTLSVPRARGSKSYQYKEVTW